MGTWKKRREMNEEDGYLKGGRGGGVFPARQIKQR